MFKLSRIPIGWLLSALTLSCATVSQAAAQTCDATRSGTAIFAGSPQPVNLTLDAGSFPAGTLPQLQTALDAGAGKWNGCSLHRFPSFGRGVPNAAEMRVLFRPGHATLDPSNPSHGRCADGSYNYPASGFARNQDTGEHAVLVYERSGCSTIPPSAADLHETLGAGSVFLAGDNLTTLFAHELGHVLGLDHDACGGGVMNGNGDVLFDGAPKDVDPAHCREATIANHPECANGGCKPDDPLAGLRPCDFLPTLCPDDIPWYRDIVVVWECSSWGYDLPGGGGSVVFVTCRRISVLNEAGGSTDRPGSAASALPPADPSGAGPHVAVLSPQEGAQVTGTITVSGTAVQPGAGVGSIAVWVDDQPVTLGGFQLHRPVAGSCAHPGGGSDPDCPNVGFSGTLDTTTLGNGIHTLQVVAVDGRSPYPLFTLVRRTIDVSNCGDVVQPSVSIAAPGEGATVSGSVAVAANATDNIGVTQVKFHVDGVLAASDSTAPYGFTWSTTPLAGGAHALQAKAYDACNNVRWSAVRTVTVASAPDLVVKRDYDSSPVPAGSSADLGQTPVNTPTSLRFRIENAGSATLTLANASTLVGGACFQQIETPASSVPAGGSAWFRVRLLCAMPGAQSGSVALQSNDPDTPSYGFALTGSVTAPAQPDMAVVRDYDNVAVPPGGSASIGTTAPNTPISVRFRIANTGNATLTLTNATALVSGACFQQIETPVASLPPGGAAWFRVRLMCSTSGLQAGSVSIASNDPDETPYSFALSGTIDAPPPVITTPPANATVNAGATAIFQVAASGALTYRWQRAPLVSGTFVSLFDDGRIGGAASSTLQIAQAGPADAARYRCLVANSEGEQVNSGPATLTVTTPDIALARDFDGSPVNAGSSVAIGSTAVNTSTSVRFRITNTGNGSLELSNATTLLSGACFHLIETPTTSIPVGGAGYFRVRLMCTTAGSYTGSVSVLSNDPDESPYVFGVTGTVTP